MEKGEQAAYLRRMAHRQRELAEEFEAQAAKVERRESLFDADYGHTWRITVEERPSSKVVGEEHHHDGPEFTALPEPVEVRAWSLPVALSKASTLPLTAWFGDD